MVPILCIVGKSNAGKTTLIVSLIPKLKAMGYRVATVKHVTHGSDLDVRGKDSWRMLDAGSDLAILSGPGQVAQFRKASGDSALEDLASYAWDYDILLVEGHKQSLFPKIEVVRKEMGLDLLCKETQLAAVVSDADLPVSIPRFRLEDVSGLARFIEETCILPNRNELTTRVEVNGQEIQLNAFAERFFARATMGMATSLRGVESIQKLAIFVRNNTGKG